MGHSENDRLVVASPSFSLDTETLGKKTKGINAEKLHADMWSKAPKSKSEFESAADFEAKHKKFRESVFSEKLTVDSRFAIIQMTSAFPSLNDTPALGDETAIESSYDAETEEMAIKVRIETGCFTLKRASKQKGKYIASNAFGRKVEITELETVELCLDLRKGRSFDIGVANKAAYLSFLLPRKEAESTSKVLAVAVIGRLVSPYIDEENYAVSGTARDPRSIETQRKILMIGLDDIWVINTTSGAVLAKLKTPFSESVPRLAEELLSSGRCRYPVFSNKEVPSPNLVVELAIDVDAGGILVGSSIQKSSGFGSLDEKVLAGISGCRFSPATKDGKAIRGTGSFKYRFSERHGRNY